ncbi:hypothetical protein [Paenirhodobacter sp. CAU 1674]|uniref:hypothetical protein n=1 Tax=Paenirhodobacter sp. CAU 1674 TaxID=3032596 RepID=UPI0023DA7743|nr:hypothetical protein [Paenirhodobacter sp. CAU 1674]MDF2143273.1 hypothetical protein [Paenirhodobacter sp. CAU 1674]
MKILVLATAASCAAFGAPALAQSLSPADILAKVEEKTKVTNGYQNLLNDPDPARSMAAMEVMLESGDAKLQRMALEYGLYSPNQQVRYTALKGFLDGQPVLRLKVDGSRVKDPSDFRRSFRSGTVDAAKIGFLSLKVGEFDPEQSCYVTSGTNDCLVRLSETEVSVRPWSAWFSTTLDDQGQLVGEVGFEPPAPVTIPVSN